MQNPSYLSQSRHHIYYFRYPLPVIYRIRGRSAHVQVSLGTRCPKQALRLAGVLEYHTIELLNHIQAMGMEYADIVRLVKDHWAKVLVSKQEEIDRTGLLSPRLIEFNQSQIEFANGVVSGAEFEDDLVLNDGSIGTVSQSLARKLSISLPQDSPEYENFVKETYFGMAWYLKELLEYNNTYRENAYKSAIVTQSAVQSDYARKDGLQSNLRIAVDKYLMNIRQDDIAARTREEREDQLNLLIEMLGANYDLFKLDARGAYYIKETLRRIPTNRNKIKAIKELSLQKQIQVPDMKKLSVGSVNKHLTCYGSFMKWAVISGFANSNPFQSMTLKDGKGKKKRDSFSPEQITVMLGELAKGQNGLADKGYKYWGALILLYTGARLNEIASLTVADVKEKDGIWYFDINDEDDDKSLKTEAAKRIVPVHSALIELGFMDFLEKSKAQRKSNERLLYELTYNSKTRWGRMLGRWFNDTFLPELGLKTDRLVLHSLRHTVITRLQQADVEFPKIQGLVGHEPDTVTMGVYGNKYTLQQLQDAIEYLKYR
ncbi:MAG: site-specific integrase [Alphaproteobacteria bacterium]|nr:site-specific integrase [Alphaproteobacteria bacterium]